MGKYRDLCSTSLIVDLNPLNIGGYMIHVIDISDLPAPENGVDGYTLSFNNCSCSFNPKLFNCACCQNNGCQCGERHRNQCVRCGHMEQCGIKPWIFGPAFNSTN